MFSFKIYTSYFAMLKWLDKDLYYPLSIANISPDWFPYGGLPYLMPNMKYFLMHKHKQMSFEEFSKKFKIQLLNTEKDYIVKMLNNAMSNHPNKSLVMMCYEADYEDCHRSIVSKYMKYTFNLDITELKVHTNKGKNDKQLNIEFE